MSVAFELRHLKACARINRRAPVCLSNIATLRRIVEEPVSLSRFGDGELFYCLQGKSLRFQPWSEDLSRRLERALLVPTPSLLQCYNHAFKASATVRWIIPLQRSQKDYAKVESLLQDGDIGVLHREKEKHFYTQCWRIVEAETRVPKYGEATVFFLGLYVDEYAKGQIEEVKDLFRRLLGGRRILFVSPAQPLAGQSFQQLEPQMRRLGLKSAQFINVPKADAFSVAESATRQILAARGFDEIFMQAGPLASVLAAELTEKLNVRVLDVGSLNTAIPYL